MMTMVATLVKCRLRPARRALSESREHTQGHTSSCEVEGLQRCLRLGNLLHSLFQWEGLDSSLLHRPFSHLVSH